MKSEKIAQNIIEILTSGCEQEGVTTTIIFTPIVGQEIISLLQARKGEESID